MLNKKLDYCMKSKNCVLS